MLNKKALLRQIRNAYETTPDNIIGVGFGLKKVADELTQRKSIVFYVKEKKPINELKPEDVLPKTISIAGIQYPCDVVQTEPFRFMVGCYDNNDQSEYEIARLQGQSEDGVLLPMRGGQEIFIFPGGWDAYGGSSLGTLGFFAIDNIDNRVVGVTNTHVVIENVLYAADPVRFPTLTLAPEVVQYNPYNTVEKRPWPVTGDYYPAGCLVRNGTDLHHAGLHIKRHVPYSTETYNYVDAALVIMNDGQFMGDGRYFVDANSYQIWQPTDLETPHTDYYPFATTEEIDELIGARCYSTGRTTGPKGYCDATTNAHLTITAVHVSAQVGFSQTIVPEFAELIQYQSPPGFETIYRASLGGDSGSALLADVVDAQTGEVRRKIVGLVFAGNGQIGLANRIDRVAETLNIRAWDASYQFTRSASLSVPTPLLITEPVATTGKYLTTTRDEETYWQAGLTFQQYYVQWAPTDITLSNNNIVETAYGGQLIGYFETVDNDIWDNFVYALVPGEGDADNASFRIIADQLQVNLPAHDSAEEDIYWRNVSFLLSAQYDCIAGTGSLIDNSLFTKVITATGNTSVVNPAIVVSDQSYPDGPDEEKWPASSRCGFGFVDIGSTNHISAEGDITLDADFTVECWLWPTSFSSSQHAAFIEGQNDSGDASRMCVYLNYGNSRGVYITAGSNANEWGSTFVTTGQKNGQSRAKLSTTAWSHLAIAREEDTVRVYVNGVIYETGTLAGTVKLKNVKLFDDFFVGYFTDLRITAVARYTGNEFAVPAFPLPQVGPETFDYETKNEYFIRVRSTDSGGNFIEKMFTINILDALEHPPTDIFVTAPDGSTAPTEVWYDIGLDEAIWQFHTVDADTIDSFEYALVPGTGATHNSLFRIADGDKLYRFGTFVSGNTYSIRVRSTDMADMFFEKVFTIAVVDPPARPFFTLQPDTAFETNQENLTGTLAGNLVITSKDANTTYDEITFELRDPTTNYPHNALFSIDNAYNDGVSNATQAQLLAAVDISAATFPNDPFFTINIRATDTRTGRFTDQDFSIGRTLPTAPQLIEFTNAWSICWGAQYSYITGDHITDLTVDYDSQSTFADITAELVSTCSGTIYNSYFAIVKDEVNNVFKLEMAADVDFNAAGHTWATLPVCVKLTDTRTNLTNTSLGYLFVGDCAWIAIGGGGS